MKFEEGAMRRRRSYCCGAAVLAVALMFGSEAIAERLSAPARRVSYVEPFGPELPVPKWSGRYLLSWRTETSAVESRDNIMIYDGNARLAARLRLWFPDATLVWIRDAAASTDKDVAVVGQAMQASGKVAGFLALTSVGSQSARVIQTSPFEGQRVVFGPDQSIWVLGYQLGDGRKLSNAPPHALVQRFNRDGRLIAESLPQSSFQCGKSPSLRAPSGYPEIAVSGDRIGVLLPACHEWLELNAKGDVLARWPWRDRPAGANSKAGPRISAVVMTAANEVYARIGPGLFHLNRKQGDWEAVNTVAARDAGLPFSWLAGSDGAFLVYSSGRELIWAGVSQ